MKYETKNSKDYNVLLKVDNQSLLSTPLPKAKEKTETNNIIKKEGMVILTLTNGEKMELPSNNGVIEQYNIRPICELIQEVEITDGVTEIGHSAFKNCVNLTEVKIPNSVKKIVRYAFKNCHNLESINIPDGVTEIDEETFFSCTKLKEVNIPDGVKKIGEGAFRRCENLENLNIPNTVKEIEGQAFCGCSSLRYVVIPEDCHLYNEERYDLVREKLHFIGCSNLQEIWIPKVSNFTFELSNKNCKICYYEEGDFEKVKPYIEVRDKLEN